MRREFVSLFSPDIGRDLHMLVFHSGKSPASGHGGVPVLVFPSSEGAFHEYEDFGMVGVLAPLIDAGKLRLYCVASYDSESWYSRSLPLHERAWRHSLYENWIMKQVVPAIADDVKDKHVRLVTTGCSFGAYHAANITLKHPRTFKLALCLSGVYDVRFLMHGHHDDWVYFNNPMEYVWHMHDESLQEVRDNVFIALVCGQGQWEDAALRSTRDFWALLDRKRIPNYLDLWGHDVSHDWHWWRQQIAHSMNGLVEGRLPWQRI
jgi:esterase/lipase superfamily enzyme